MISAKGCKGFKYNVLYILCFVLCFPGLANAQGTAPPLSSQTLGRAYWHVFLAYAIAWLLVLLWVVAMSKRLGQIEDRIGPAKD